ncbi:hypothetical protein [Pedobacter cryoconitis]|uniref:O-acetylhomoserine/O-acetylserine sulfhydrylase-like pyridoxal-dependent enzyme n=1 Tax=Pedobacter cryoconitis TaxID=188932 RepID=A0A7X0JAE1_9SPHI|nr:hypothetical protein [Pedobacter cryoconitis]MBB6502932.1 O-acetylhomoserine/O-acetylserine sulfhydrylase-like pyridoxal-dependent enzyme [Pedobacter cryoconitis]
MGTTIGNVLISYDINKSHTQVKTALEALGYSDKFKNINDPKTYMLPNTTLWHDKKNSNQAMSELRTVCAKLDVVLEKAVTVKADEFVGI